MYKQAHENSSVVKARLTVNYTNENAEKNTEKTWHTKAQNALSELVNNPMEAQVTITKTFCYQL